MSYPYFSSLLPICLILTSCLAPTSGDEASQEGGAGANGVENVTTIKQGILGSDACKNPRIEIFNASNRKIKITELRYEDLTSDKLRYENVEDRTLEPQLESSPTIWDSAYDSTVYTDTLEYTKNHRIGRFKVTYSYYDNGSWHGPYDKYCSATEGSYNKKCVSNANTYYGVWCSGWW